MGEVMGLMMCDYGFKIKSKADAKAFFEMKKHSKVSASDGEFYWSDGKEDYYLEVRKDYRGVYSRPCWARGDIFFPYCQELDPLDVIWKTRKYINAKWFTRE